MTQRFKGRSRPRSAGTLAALLALLVVGCAQIPSSPVLISPAGHQGGARSTCALETTGASPRAGEAGSAALGRGDGRIHLVSWNVQKGQALAWSTDLDAVRESDSIVLLQEAAIAHRDASDPPARDGAPSALVHWTLVEAFSRGSIHAGVLNGGPILPEHECAHHHAEPLIVVPKSMLASRYPLVDRDRSLLVINLHGVNFTLGHRRFREQLEAAAMLLRAHEGPAILAGDLNTWSDRRLALVTETLRDAGLAPVAFEGRQPRRHLGRILDHVFYRGLVVDAARVVPVESSDHDPLTVAFRLAKAAP